MNERALHILEYDKVIERLAEYATSEPGRKRCMTLLPASGMEAVHHNLQQTDDAISRIFRRGSISFGNTRDFSGALRALKIGASLGAAELLQIAAFQENVARVKSYGRSAAPTPEDDSAPADSLAAFFSVLEPLAPLSSEIRRCILSEDEISPEASPQLKSIRRSIRLSADRIHEQLNRMVNGPLRSYLQDGVITMRGSRYCLPVRAEYKSQVSGIVHDQSATGSTLFVEPSAIVELNNRLKEFELQENAEIERILAALSAQAGESADVIAANQEVMTALDFIFAKGSFALSMNATIPLMNERRAFHIRKGRHPLIDAGKAVPIDVWLGRESDPFSMLIITGPNTGGKTVTLKTVGLLTLMGQAGLAIPAADRSELSVFTEVYADIGDEQSIEQSLSTFSSHMKNIVQILQEADTNALCLFDELGAGTDPTEGAALAISILNDLHTRGVCTLATTHYSELKVYAMTTPGVENASCEFDVESLRPTYRLLIGLPGKSNAFAISSRLGLPRKIIDAANAQLSQDNRRLEDLLADLEQTRRSAENERLTAAAAMAEIERRQAELSAQLEKLNRSRDEILRKANEDAREILQEAKQEADNAIRMLRKSGDADALRALERTRTGLNEGISKRNNALSFKKEPLPAPQQADAEEISPGDTVRVVSMGLTGTVISGPDKSGRFSLQCGMIHTKAAAGDLVRIAKQDPPKSRGEAPAARRVDISRAAHIHTELNLIGKNTDDALASLSKYLDEAYLSHLSNVRIVHGKGEGILRRAVQNYLKKVPYVKSCRLGEYGEGDSGVTIVTFK